MRRLVLTPLLVAVLLAAAGCGSSDGDGPALSAPQSTAADVLPGRWWAWTESVPPDQNPIADTTGAHCAAGQPDDVWFLAGTYGGSAKRSCAIPSGRQIYFPVINQVCYPADPQIETAIADCRSGYDVASATIDGKDLTVSEGASTEPFRFRVSAGSRLGTDPGTYNAVAWGMWVGPLSVSAGRHVLKFVGKAGEFRLKVTYRLTVG